MPIAPTLLDDLDLSGTTTGEPEVDTKFFDAKLTGCGKKGGLLNETVHPRALVSNTAYSTGHDVELRGHSTQNDVTVTTIPLAPLLRRAVTGTRGVRIPVPAAETRYQLDLAPGAPDCQVVFDLTPQALTLYEDKSTGSNKRDLVVQYRMELVFSPMTSPHVVSTADLSDVCQTVKIANHPQDVPSAALVSDMTRASSHNTCGPIAGKDDLNAIAPVGQPHELERIGVLPVPNDLPAGFKLDPTLPAAFVDWSASPMDTAAEFITARLADAGLVAGNLGDELQQWMHDYSLYTHVLDLAEVWSGTGIGMEVCEFIDDLPNDLDNDHYRVLAAQLRSLENYNVVLDVYADIHQRIAAKFDNHVAAGLAKANLNLLMHHTLAQLEELKPKLARLPEPAVPPQLAAHVSVQQRAALTTHEPLVMTQAGAGSGKSSTIGWRIGYAQACGVNPKDITVLSFTNAAADNIAEKNPSIGSMTIARMIIDIYSANYPTHKVSAIDTIINSLDIFYANDDVAMTFRKLLLAVDQNKTSAFTDLNTFIENHFDAVMGLLDRIEQTSLELQIIISYQRIEQMVEPAHVTSKHLIIDEVQDNSIFEFVFLLKYITKHLQSLFIVGDASQTLYEFRSANPRALNILEASGIFATYRLSTNYRSNQEILDFANFTLTGLETNRIAKLQLQANSFAVPTVDTFTDKVKLDYRDVQRLSEFTEDMPGILRHTIIPEYVQPCLDRGEQVAFLAHSRRDVTAMQNILEAVYPDKNVACLMSDRVYATDIFSKYIKKYWNDVLQVQPAHATYVITQGIQANLDKLTKNAANPKVSHAIVEFTSNWWTENARTIDAWLLLYTQQGLSAAEFFERLRDSMLSFEIRRNQEKLNVNKSRNADRKKKSMAAKPDLIVSTIHGAKGLEFDNVVVIHKEDKSGKQDSRREYYVAFTRAIKSEYILSHGNVANPLLVSGYEVIVNALTRRDNERELRAAGLDPDLIDAAELDDVLKSIRQDQRQPA